MRSVSTRPLAAALVALAMNAPPLARPASGAEERVTGALQAQGHVHPAAANERLGTVHFATSCTEQAQPLFDRAVSLLHSFEFGPAIDAFNETLTADPTCAMTQWGIALSHWSNPFGLNTRSRRQLEQGLAAVERGRAIRPNTDRERAWLEAVALLYADAAGRSQQARVQAYRDAMEVLARTHPVDMEAAIFFALSLTAAEDPSDKTYASRLRAVGILEPLFKAHPEHPGLAHYIIHSYDVPELAPRALDAAKRYAEIAPSAAHALHMPSHTFTRVGLWQPSIDANIASADVARKQRVTGEELHASDYQMYAYLQSGQDAAARQLLDALPGIIARYDATSTQGAAPPSAAYYAMAAIPARWALERGAWADAERLELRPSGLPYVDALTEFARAMGAARVKDAATVRSALTRLDALRTAQVARNEPYWTQQIEIQRDAAAAWLAFVEGRQADAIAAMRAVADTEDRTEKAAVTPGPLAPAREQLGEMLLASGDARAARVAFEATLAKEPNRFRALAGAARAAAASGDAAAERRHLQTLVTICERAETPGRVELQQARATLAR
jgi:hypothetical protein